ncbi:hypothetical protein FQA47_006014 [Oryzias melastigma]|uniref:Uncharacterized protein n=1 Tax=Oryzias melastigma TaxID=30732 RepID=A0A834C4H5_ORYME|nr:hypothetical protein FQA47_006014 [Oryzias melastigma]
MIVEHGARTGHHGAETTGTGEHGAGTGKQGPRYAELGAGSAGRRAKEAFFRKHLHLHFLFLFFWPNTPPSPTCTTASSVYDTLHMQREREQKWRAPAEFSTTLENLANIRPE